MSKHTKSSLLEIQDKINAGKASLEQNEIDDLIVNLSIEINNIIKENALTNRDESEICLNIFNGLFDAEMANSFMQTVDKQLFYQFGEYLLAQDVVDNKNVTKIIHCYLSLFRYPFFLSKIYNDRKWDDLIYKLIVKSCYTFNVLFDQRVNQYKKKNLFRIIKDNKTIDYTWEKSKEIISGYRASLNNLLFEISSENKIVAFLLENSLEMVMLDLACLTSGFVNAMIPANSVSEHIAFILNQTKATILFADDEKQLSKIRSIKNETPQLKTVVLIKGNAAEDWVISFEEFKALASHSSPELKPTIKPESLATLMYTSGTTGEPKGIMFSHTNIVYKRFCRAMAIPGIGDEDRYLAFLPLYHTFGRWLEMTGAIFWGAEYCFMENPSVETMIENMQLVKPTIFISIPKKWIQLYEYITTRVDIEVEDEQVIKSTVSKVTGGKLRWGLSAAGFLPPDIFRFFQRYKVELMSGFGMTEATGGITMTPPFLYRENSLGKALPGIEIKIGDDGEILIRGPYVMINYYNQKSEDTFDSDGWLATGDVMRIDKDGFIEIIDRKKEIYKNIKGETIAPQKIENLFRDFEFAKQVFLAGDHRPFNTVLIYPDIESESSPLKNMDEQQLQEYFSTVIVTINNFLAPFERIVDFRLINRPFTDAHHELTPKGTYKRRVIEKNFEEIIQSMYQKDHLSLSIDKYEIKIPNWFLREKGALSRDVFLKDNLLTIPKLQSSLEIRIINKDINVIQIGNYSYKISSSQVDFQDILTNPYYWLGNVQLVEFTGSGIFRWFRKSAADKDIEFINRIIPIISTDVTKNQLIDILQAKEISILGLHYAVALLQSDLLSHNELAIEYFTEILKDTRSTHYKLAVEVACRPNLIISLSTRQKMFLAALQTLKKESFRRILSLYSAYDAEFLSKDVIQAIDNSSRGSENLVEIESVLQERIKNFSAHSNISGTSIPNLFSLLISYGVNHPSSYERIRRFFLQYELYGSTSEIRTLAADSRMEIRNQFTTWLGDVQRVAIDSETGEEYRWEDVLVFDQAISENEQVILRKAISEKQIIREAIFLFTGSVLISLNNILPSGVWISRYSESENRSVFRVTVQTRFQGGFDLAIHLNHNEPSSTIEEEIKWKVIAGTEANGEKLAAKLGGLWEDYNLWTEEFVGDESVERFIRREYKRNDGLTFEKLRNLWKFFVWNASAAYVKFWKLSELKMELINPSPDEIIISEHDYQIKSIITSFSKRRKTETTLGFMMNFYESFIGQTENKYPLIKKASVWNAIFSGVIEALGLDDGINLIKKFREELDLSQLDSKDNIIYRIDSLLHNIKNHGFLPKQLYFSIKRFHRWYDLNKNASLSAQAEMIYELYETYRLFDLEEQYPAARTRFFLETVFYYSTQRFKEVLRELVKKQRHRKISKEESLKLINTLHFEFELDEKETYFITRLGYPHLKPTDSAALLRIKSEIARQPNLVVQLQDDDGNVYTIRNPINPKEISKLHQLYLEANLNVNFRPEHHFLVAVSERGFIIGGAFYYRNDENTVHMEKIVVSNRYRRKGISEGLMNELFSRVKSENIKFVTTGFFRPEYFYRFGFKIERKYSGLVKEL
jgi:long-chain acyl-CoA synthetase